MPENVKKPIFKFPPAVKVLVRGYLIIGFLLALEAAGAFTSTGVIIFCITIISISMVFGVGYLLAVHRGPVRKNEYDIPNTVLFFVKGSMILYFVSLLGQFHILPGRIVSVLMFIISVFLIMAGVLSYVHEVIQRARPLPKRRPVRAR